MKWAEDAQKMKWVGEPRDVECTGLARMLGSKD